MIALTVGHIFLRVFTRSVQKHLGAVAHVTLTSPDELVWVALGGRSDTLGPRDVMLGSRSLPIVDGLQGRHDLSADAAPAPAQLVAAAHYQRDRVRARGHADCTGRAIRLVAVQLDRVRLRQLGRIDPAHGRRREGNGANPFAAVVVS